MKPYRSKAFLRFAHQAGGRCCVCGGTWQELHHFGGDGGMALKPSDNEVARLCRKCHRENDFKRRALERRDQKNGTQILEAMQADALQLNRAWIEHLEGK